MFWSYQNGLPGYPDPICFTLFSTSNGKYLFNGAAKNGYKVTGSLSNQSSLKRNATNNPYFCYTIIMYFKNYSEHPDAKINPSLLWEYNFDKVDFMTMRNIVVQRVVERGWPQDWFAMLNLYGVNAVKEAIKELSYLNEKDMNFVSQVFDIPLTDLKCYTKKQSAQPHWNS